jgi:mRNA interferase YafQ
MKSLFVENSFKRDLKLARKRGRKIELLETLVGELRLGNDLAPKHRLHKLVGEWSGIWECHIQPDWLLVYDYDEISLTLIRTGSHSDLFD